MRHDSNRLKEKTGRAAGGASKETGLLWQCK